MQTGHSNPRKQTLKKRQPYQLKQVKNQTFFFIVVVVVAVIIIHIIILYYYYPAVVYTSFFKP